VQKFPIWVKIADFGISKQIQGDDTFLKTWTGTIPFMAPEFYIPNQKYTSAVDVWSLGCVLYFLLTKCHPFPDPGQVIRYGYREAELPKGNLKDRKVSDAGIRFIEGLMAPKPNDRTKVSRALNDPWIGDQSQSTQFLLQKGFDTSAVDFNANKALLLAAAKDYKGDIVRLLLWKGASIATTTYGWTALHHAADKGHEAVVRSLLERGADVATKNNYGCTALHRAACHGHEAVVLLLLEKGGAVAAKTALLWTALHLAAYKGHERVVRLLLEKGADAKAKTFTGQTALRMAARNGHEAVVKLLTPLTPDS
jgi:ankyrin repeat protein